MNTFQIFSIILAVLIPISFVIGFYIAVKIDVAKLEVKVEFLTTRIEKLENKIDDFFNLINNVK
jgi:uncharacterized membrane protein YciS (DUF1049 family)